ncbi:uncharacterized protein LOC141723716 [Apium graveolens]|uniref:uncharacterized protein LOC141723716 n=1 Tax=Apium graveolens TaxID=4045 RepID=UPI003D7BA5E8
MSSFHPELQQLKVLLPELEALQNAMVAYEVYANEVKKFKALEDEHKDCSQKLQTALDRASINMKTAPEIQQEFDEFVAKVQSLEKEMKDEAVKLVTQHVMCTRVEMMLEYSEGEWKNWDVDETMKIYNDTYLDDIFRIPSPNGEDNEEGGDKSAKDLDVVDK